MNVLNLKTGEKNKYNHFQSIDYIQNPQNILFFSTKEQLLNIFKLFAFFESEINECEGLFGRQVHGEKVNYTKDDLHATYQLRNHNCFQLSLLVYIYIYIYINRFLISINLG